MRRNLQLCLRVHGFMNKKSLSPGRFALMAGLPPYDFSSYLRGHCLADVADIEKKISAVLSREADKKNLPRSNPGFIETSISKRIWESCKLCHLQNDIAVIFGDAGIGKSMACREYVARHADAVFVECLVGFSATYLFAKLCELLNLNENMGLRYSFEAVQKQLRDSGRLIILDEAEHVTYRGLDLLRRIHDFTGVGIVMVGLQKLLSNLRGKTGEYRQLFSRVGIAVRLDTINESDAENMVREWIPSAGDLWTEAWKRSNSNARRLSKICKMSLHIADVNNCEVNKEVIKAASELLIS